MRKLWLLILTLLLMYPVYASAQITRQNDYDCNDIPTDTEWEGEIDNIINNGLGNLANIADASANAAAHQATKDPTGALPTSLLQEIQELRDKILDLQPNNTYWYDNYDPHEYGYANLVPNGGFEYWDDGITSAPNGWELVGGTTVSQTINSNTGYTGDTWAIEVTSAGVTSNGIKHTFSNLKASTTYNVTVRAKATAGDTAKASTAGGASNLSQTTTTQSWVYSLNGTFTTDATPTDVVLTLGSDTSGDIVYFDEVMVVEGSMAHGYARHIPSVPLTHPTHRKLVVKPGSDTNKIDIDADYIVAENPNIEHRIILQKVDETCNIASSGVRGLDVGSEAANTTYYQYIIYKPSTAEVDSLMSSSDTSPVLPSGYTYYKLVSFARNDSGSAFIPYWQNDKMLLYYEPSVDTNFLNNGQLTSWTDANTTNYTGSNAVCKQVILGWYFDATSLIATEDSTAYIRPDGSSVSTGKLLGKIEDDGTGDLGTSTASGELFYFFSTTSQIIEYQLVETGTPTYGASGGLDMFVNGCILDI